MAHFDFETDGAGRVLAIYKDGVRQQGPVTLEAPQGLVQSYFSAALRSFLSMRADADGKELRDYGLQSYLMSLTGLEAFVNVYFHRRGFADGNAELIARADEWRPVEQKLSHLPRIAFGSNLPDQRMINRKVRELYDLRSSIVHPKLELSSMVFEGVAVSGMVQNFQKTFEDPEFCREALQWCLLVVAKIGLAAQEMGDMFVVFWTTVRETDASLSKSLGINPDASLGAGPDWE